MTTPLEPSSPGDAIARLHTAIERAVRWISPGPSTSPDTVSLTADAAEAFADKLASRTAGGGLWGHVSGAGNSEARGVFVVGLAEPAASGITVTMRGDSAEAVFIAPPTFEGPDGAMHGGQVANLFDEVCGVAQSLGANVNGRTATLNVTYHHPVPLGKPLRVSASVTGLEGRKVTVQASIYDGETLCASAEALFIQRGV